jgi:hypothetical protein
LIKTVGQLPVQVTVGTALADVQDPMNPKVVEAPAASAPFQAALDAVTTEPLWLTLAPHDCVTVWPLANVQVAVQAEIARVALTVTEPWNPPGQEPAIA